ncbi:hypothetical protein B0T17DRAFT_651460 [Bombardia bombarda]|uniref:RBR-type E3 ubiquitin transferase n=1 Tax=Bombardia bombarda TaxID=252184 RepID=A0AA39XMG0_9PEZI|nr:hypothetical protein B0T17DRAFT_651460 [Bombardia bombarda]
MDNPNNGHPHLHDPHPHHQQEDANSDARVFPPTQPQETQSHIIHRPQFANPNVDEDTAPRQAAILTLPGRTPRPPTPILRRRRVPISPTPHVEVYRPDCVSCLEKLSFPYLRVKCGHHFCPECLCQLFDLACRDWQLWPPKCCRHILLDGSLGVLPDALLGEERVALYHRRVDEEDERLGNKIYCSNPICSAEIKWPDWRAGVAVCSGCQHKTCTRCRAQMHEGSCATVPDPALAQVHELAHVQKWTQCKRCGQIIEKIYGCAHIVCLCKHEFCYLCGKNWGDCRQDGWGVCRLDHVRQDEALQQERRARIADIVARTARLAEMEARRRVFQQQRLIEEEARRLEWEDQLAELETRRRQSGERELEEIRRRRALGLELDRAAHQRHEMDQHTRTPRDT